MIHKLLVILLFLSASCNDKAPGEIISKEPCSIEGSIESDIYSEYNAAIMYLVNKTPDKKITFTIKMTTINLSDNSKTEKTMALFTNPGDEIELGCSHGISELKVDKSYKFDIAGAFEWADN